MRVCKLGDGLAIPLSADVVEALHLAEGDVVEISASGPRCARLEKKLDPEAMVAKLRSLPKLFPAGFVFNRDEANER